jgi:hypothetical protein
MKKLLIVSPHFPPINAPDMQRVRMSLPYYRRYGWEPVVLAVGEAWQDGVREPALAATVPADVRVIRTRAWSNRWTRLVGFHHLGWRAWYHLYRTGSRLLRREKFDAVFFSNTQFITFTLGPLWRRRFGVPFILDVQDPWRTDYYERPGSRRPPGGWKYLFARLQARALEGFCFRRAAAVMSVSPVYLEHLRARYREMAFTPSTVLRFGASLLDLDQAERLPRPVRTFARDHGEKHLVYTGASGPIMPHALTVLFTALRRYRARAPERAARLHLHFVGTSYVAEGRGEPSVRPIAEACGVADQVEEIPHRIGHLEALQLQQAADVLLLLGSSDLAYSPSKVYLYYLTGRPILGVVFQNSIMERLLDELACAYLARFRADAPKDEAYAGLERFFDAIFDGFPAGMLPVRNEAHFRAYYLAEELTRLQCRLFDRALAVSP